ncbi:MAG: hypothetical protein IT196_22660 [Acidimicrobiales bacterium]|nr:hypothetical protein [Acidimicrobiales bacterium]
MTVEFKEFESDPLNDTELVEAVACLANGSGGLLFVGVRPAHHAAEAAEPCARGRSSAPAWWIERAGVSTASSTASRERPGSRRAWATEVNPLCVVAGEHKA